MFVLLVSTVFSACTTTTITGNIGTKQSFSSGCIVVQSSFFAGLKSPVSGGAIEINSGVESLLVDKSVFVSCSCGQMNGGAILVRLCSVNIKTTCYYSCSAVNSGHAMAILNANTLLLTHFSVFKCSPHLIDASTSGIRALGGVQSFSNGNFSSSISDFQAGLIVRDYSSTTQKFINFADNTAGKRIIFNVYHDNGVISTVYNNNFINNKVSSPSSAACVVYADITSVYIYDSVFYGNAGLNEIFCTTSTSYVRVFRTFFDKLQFNMNAITDENCIITLHDPLFIPLDRFSNTCFGIAGTFEFSRAKTNRITTYPIYFSSILLTSGI